MPEDNKPLVVGLSSSPRTSANTDAVVKEVLAGAAEAGAQTQLVRLADLSIAPCNACYYCQSHSGCNIDDDMTSVYERLLAADAWVIGTPVYWYTANAVLKAALERMFAWYMDPAGNPARAKARRAVAVTLCGDTNTEEQGAPVFKMLETGLPDYDVDLIGCLALRGVAVEDVEAHWKDFEPARRLGGKLVQ